MKYFALQYHEPESKENYFFLISETGNILLMDTNRTLEGLLNYAAKKRILKSDIQFEAPKKVIKKAKEFLGNLKIRAI